MTTNSQLSTTKPKETKQNKNKLSKQLEQEQKSQKWRSHGGLAAERGNRESEGKCTGNKKHKWQVQNRQGEGKNSVGNGEAKELTCMTHGHELRWGNAGGRWGARQRGIEGRKNETTIIA